MYEAVPIETCVWVRLRWVRAVRLVEPGQAEVGHLGNAAGLLVEEDVLWLEIAVDDAAAVRVLDGPSTSSMVISAWVDVEVGLAHLLAQRRPVDELHHQVVRVARLAAIDDGDDLRVATGSPARRLLSRSARRTARLWRAPCLSNFTATVRCSDSCVAMCTSPMPPRPTGRTRRYPGMVSGGVIRAMAVSCVKGTFLFFRPRPCPTFYAENASSAAAEASSGLR